MKTTTSKPTHKKAVFYLLISVLFLIFLFFQINQFYPRGLLIIGDDIHFHLTRMLGIASALNDGSFPFYINSSYIYGYGYAANWFYPDLFLIPASIMYNLNIHLIRLVKIYYAILSVATFISMFYCSNKITKDKYISAIAAFLYTFCQYRAIDLYWRFSIGESLAFIFLPIILYGCYEVFNGNPKKWYVLTIGFSGMLYSHLISTLLAFIMVIIYMLFSYRNVLKNGKRIVYLLLAGITTVFIGSFQLFPMFEQMFSNTFMFMINKFTYPVDNAYLASQIFNNVFSITSSSSKGWRMYGLGFATALPLLSRFFIKKSDNELILLADRLLIISVIFLCFTTSLFPWNSLHIFDYIQFPWRFNLLISLLVSFISGIYLVFLIKKNKYFYVGLPLVLIALIINTCNSASLFVNHVDSKYGYFVSEKTTCEQIYAYDIGGGREYLPTMADLDYLMIRGNDYITLSPDDIEITNYRETSKKLSFNFKSNENDNSFVLPKVWYKGYASYINGVEIKNTINDDGLVCIQTTESSGYIELVYKSTTIQRFSLYISLFSFLLLTIWIVYLNIKEKHVEKQNI